MKIKINQLKFKEGVGITERISSRSSSLPILKNIIIRAQKNIINISSTDLETGIQWWAIAKTEKEGEVVVPANILSGFINFLPDKNIELTTIKNDLIIECGSYKTQIKGFNSDDFPIIPEVAEKNSILINAKDLCKGLSQISDIPSFSTTRPEISGIFFNFKKDRLKLVATDSYRLGEKSLLLNKVIENDFSFILPQKAVKEIIGIFGEKDGDINIVLGASQVLFELTMKEIIHPQIKFTSRIIEGEYPNYEEIIPAKNSIQAILNRNDLLNQIKAAGLFSGKVSEVVLRIDPDKKEVAVLSQSPESGEYSSTLTGKITGKKESVSFNHRFLTDGLGNIKSSEIVFETNSGSEPGVFKPVGESDFLYIVMPIRAN